MVWLGREGSTLTHHEKVWEEENTKGTWRVFHVLFPLFAPCCCFATQNGIIVAWLPCLISRLSSAFISCSAMPLTKILRSLRCSNSRTRPYSAAIRLFFSLLNPGILEICVEETVSLHLTSSRCFFLFSSFFTLSFPLLGSSRVSIEYLTSFPSILSASFLLTLAFFVLSFFPCATIHIYGYRSM